MGVISYPNDWQGDQILGLWDGNNNYNGPYEFTFENFGLQRGSSGHIINRCSNSLYYRMEATVSLKTGEENDGTPIMEDVSIFTVDDLDECGGWDDPCPVTFEMSA